MKRFVPIVFIFILLCVFEFGLGVFATEMLPEPSMAQDLIQNGSYEEGLAILKNYTLNNTTDPVIWNSIGYALNNLGRFEEAIDP